MNTVATCRQKSSAESVKSVSLIDAMPPDPHRVPFRKTAVPNGQRLIDHRGVGGRVGVLVGGGMLRAKRKCY